MALLSPTLWFVAALVALVLWRRARAGRAWRVLAGLLVAGGCLAPASFGAHGGALQLRLLLLGMAALLPAIELDWRARLTRFAVAAVLVALALQTAFVWEYSLRCHRAIAALMQAAPVMGERQRVGTLVLERLPGFRGNAPLHADSLLGINTGNIIWSNYEAQTYYFPVRFRPGAGGPPAAESEAVANAAFDGQLAAQLPRWEQLVERYHPLMDYLVVWGADPEVSAINARFFVPVLERDQLHLWKHR
jgi:hypothetical protein